MAQGKLKVKSKIPKKAKKNQQTKKGQSFTQRSNRPVKAKAKLEESAKLKKTITKTVNSAAEQEIRNMAAGGSHKLTKAQEAVVKHNTRSVSKK